MIYLMVDNLECGPMSYLGLIVYQFGGFVVSRSGMTLLNDYDMSDDILFKFSGLPMAK